MTKSDEMEEVKSMKLCWMIQEGSLGVQTFAPGRRNPPAYGKMVDLEIEIIEIPLHGNIKSVALL